MGLGWLFGAIGRSRPARPVCPLCYGRAGLVHRLGACLRERPRI